MCMEMSQQRVGGMYYIILSFMPLTVFNYRLMMKKINKEFQEVMFTKTEGRMIEQLTVMFSLAMKHCLNLLEAGGGNIYCLCIML